MRKLCLIIIDGLGVAPPGPGNARELADTPTLDRLEREEPSVLMEAAGTAVGLPEGQQGASEPGHLTIGAGRIVLQPLEQINQAIRSGSFEENAVLANACDRAAGKNAPLHLIGLYSSGGVHSSIEHWHAMLKLARSKGVGTVYLHLFSDGRDVPEQHFCTDFDLLKQEVSKQQLGTIASLVGRYFAMDRDKQYDRTKVAYDLLTQGKGEETEDLCEGAKQWYLEAGKNEDTDYYIRPLKTSAFKAIGEDDVVVCINFRSDRMIQIVKALEEEDFSEFPRPVRVTDVSCMGPYSDHLPVAYPPPEIPDTLGAVIAESGGKQLRVAETDKFAHVTFFFNAQRHEPYEGEERILIESPKVSNYAEKPEMSAAQVADTVIQQAQNGAYDFIAVNFANPDLVGHGGDLDAAVRACETVDAQLARLLPALEEAGYDWIVTADHGNAEAMLYGDGVTVCPSHTDNRVRTSVHSSIFSSQDDLEAFLQERQNAGGKPGLKDVAPLCLRILDVPVSEQMQGVLG